MSEKQHLACIAMAVLIMFTGCESVQQALNLSKPTARITGLSFQDVQLNSATLLFDVEVDNPYPVALPLMNLDYDLSTGSAAFLAGRADLQTTIPAKSSKTISLPAKINYIEMLRALKNVKLGSKIPYKADVGLSVDTPALGLLRLPLKKEGEVVIPTV